MEGVDIYDPVTNTVRSTGAEKVAVWFLDVIDPRGNKVLRVQKLGAEYN